jgi:phenylacetate-CoA ligase
MLRVLKWRQFLKKSERWSVYKQIQYQNSKLIEIVNHCYKNVPFYRRTFSEYDINPSSIREISDFKKLPTINRETLKSYYDELIADNFKKFRPQTVTSGGTTGVPESFP